MKKIYLLLFAMFIKTLSANAQTADFPDPMLKLYLVNMLCVDTDSDYEADEDIDTNNNGEIEVSEVEAVLSLFIDDNSITSIEGIQQFTNLEVLRVMHTQITIADFSGMENLYSLGCIYNPELTSIDLDGLTGLLYLNCSNNDLSIVDASQTTAQEFSFSSNPNMTYINIRNGIHTDCITLLMEGSDYTCAMFLDLPALQVVCLDDSEMEPGGFHSSYPQENVQFVANDECTLGTDLQTVNNFLLYPNPVKDVMHIAPTQPVEIKSVMVYNLLGQQITGINISGTVDSITINTSGLPAGQYLIAIETDKGKTVSKLIKQ